MDSIAIYLQGLPLFFLYLIIAVLMLSAFMVCYSRMTPHKEWTLIRQGNSAAASAYGGSIIGFVIPLATAMTQSVSLFDFIAWGLIAFAVQVLTFFAIKRVLRRFGESLAEHITEGHQAFGILVASVSIAVGILNAASMVW